MLTDVVLQPWHWLVLGLLLLAAEAMGAGGFVLGAAAAAGLLALLLWLMPELSWASQFMVFAVAAVVFSVAYWKLFRGFNDRTEQPQLNDRAAQLIGRQLTLEQPLPKGQSRLQIGDTLWKVSCAEALPQGTRIEVTAADGMMLTVNAAD